MTDQLARDSLKIAGLFAGIGGIELGLHDSGHRTELLCENDPTAKAVLGKRFPAVELVDDIRTVRKLPSVDLVAAGFPCQDLSQAGRTAGINGHQSSLVENVFRLLDNSPTPEWLLLENVPFMLRLERGQAMRYLVHELEKRRFSWAYRIVDSRAFGLPQRRQRVLLLASKTEDPRKVLLVDDAGEPETPSANGKACGFYWTEGIRGLGWAVDAVPPIKGGSGLGIPSPPAILLPQKNFVGVPDLRDAERLQGFTEDWTLPAEEAGLRASLRWKLVGNAVSVPVTKWVGERLKEPGTYKQARDAELEPGQKWPNAAWGMGGAAYGSAVSMWPVRYHYESLLDYLNHPLKPLSVKATAGFLSRTERSSLRFPPGFLDSVTAHLKTVQNATKD